MQLNIQLGHERTKVFQGLLSGFALVSTQLWVEAKNIAALLFNFYFTVVCCRVQFDKARQRAVFCIQRIQVQINKYSKIEACYSLKLISVHC